MPLIGIRVDGDAGAEAGMGHVYRSVAYARRLMKELPDISVRFYMRDFPEGRAKVAAEGYSVSVLPTRPQRSDFQRVFDENPPDLLIIDILGSSHDLIEAGRKSARAVITVDDLEPSAAETDAVVNGILWGTRLLPNPFGRARVYQGIEYIQLREDFAKANQNPRLHSSRVSSILISTGGADLREFTPQLMQAISKLSFDCAVSVIVGPAFHNLPSLQEAAQALSGRSNFSLVPDADDMAERLLKSDIALLTGGTVMFESAACGTPAIIVCSYENQFPQAEWFARKGMAVNLGYRPGELDQSRVVRVLEELARNPKKRGQMSEAMKATVDGRGLDRFVEIVRAAL